MNEQEMLKCAAKSASYDFYVNEAAGSQEIYVDGKVWNPKTCDRDAFRLALDLGIDVSHEFDEDCVYAFWQGRQNTLKVYSPPDNYDQYSAAREAILLAACEIYKKWGDWI